MLLWENPMLSARDCRRCWVYQYADDGRMDIDRGGKPRRRLKGLGPPCTGPKGCPKGTIDKHKSLTIQNAMAYRHYMECKATGSFPDDQQVRNTARVIAEIEAFERRKQAVMLESFIKAMATRP